MTFLLLDGKLATQNGKLILDSSSSYEEFVKCCCGSDCPCADTIPDTLTATFEIVGTDGSGCECIDGATITLNREAEGAGASICADLGQDIGNPRWSGSATICDQKVCLCFVVCDSGPDDMHLLMGVAALTCSTALQDVAADSGTSNCNPLFAEVTYTSAMLQALCFNITDNRELKVTVTP